MNEPSSRTPAERFVVVKPDDKFYCGKKQEAENGANYFIVCSGVGGIFVSG